MKRGPRWLHHLYANLNGYFWLPCPVCGRKFGGHEWTYSIQTSPGWGEGVCSEKCSGDEGLYTRVIR